MSGAAKVDSALVEAGPGTRTRRAHERIPTALKVVLQEGASGVTRDVSASGIYFRTAAAPGQGESIEFAVEFVDNTGQRTWVLECKAAVVRVEPEGDGFGVAAKIIESKLGVAGLAQG